MARAPRRGRGGGTLPPPPAIPVTPAAPLPLLRKIRRLSARKVIALCKEYGIKSTGLTNETDGRWAHHGVIAGGAILIGGAVAFKLVPSVLPLYDHGWVSQLVLFAGIVATPLLRARHLFLAPPPYTYVQGNNRLNGNLHTYTQPRILPKFFFEKVTDNDYIDVRVIIIDGMTLFLTKDGIPLQFNWTIQVRINDQLLAINLRHTLEGLSKGLADVVENTLTKDLMGKTAQEARDPQVTRRIEYDIRNELNAPLPEDRTAADRADIDTVPTDIEQNPIWVRFGIITEIATLGEPKFDTDYQQAMTAKTIADMINDTAKKFREGLPGLPPDVALNSALIVNKESVTRQAFAVEGVDAALGKALHTVMRVWRKGPSGGTP